MNYTVISSYRNLKTECFPNVGIVIDTASTSWNKTNLPKGFFFFFVVTNKMFTRALDPA